MKINKITKDSDFTFSLNGVYFGHYSVTDITYEGSLNDDEIEIFKVERFVRLDFKNQKPVIHSFTFKYLKNLLSKTSNNFSINKLPQKTRTRLKKEGKGTWNNNLRKEHNYKVLKYSVQEEHRLSWDKTEVEPILRLVIETKNIMYEFVFRQQEKLLRKRIACYYTTDLLEIKEKHKAIIALK